LVYCGISRQGHEQARKRLIKEAEMAIYYIRLMDEIRWIHPGMGLRTMYDMAGPEGIGRDAFIALGLQEGYRLKTVESQTRTTYSVKSSRYRNLLVGEEFTEINQVWSSDITYFLCKDQFFYIVFIMDVYTRRIVGYNIADNMRAENNLAALEMALKTRGIKDYKKGLIHHSDKGTQYASDRYTDKLEEYGIRISMCNEVYENTHIERVNGTIKNQYLSKWENNNKQDLKKNLDRAVKAYNETKPHENLKKMSPINFEKHLLTIEKASRYKLSIYTGKWSEKEKEIGQLNLFD
jgi:putative transposase